MGKLAGKTEPTPKIKKTGRPKISDRTKLSKQDLHYATMRANGMSIAQASKSIARPIGEMQRLEREFGLLRREIEDRRREKLHIDTDGLTAFLHQDLLNVHEILSEIRLDPDRRDINEIIKVGEALSKIKLDMEDLEERARQEQEQQKPEKQEKVVTFGDWLREDPDINFRELVETLDPGGRLAQKMIEMIDPELFLRKVTEQVKAELLKVEKPKMRRRKIVPFEK